MFHHFDLILHKVIIFKEKASDNKNQNALSDSVRLYAGRHLKFYEEKIEPTLASLSYKEKSFENGQEIELDKDI